MLSAISWIDLTLWIQSGKLFLFFCFWNPRRSFLIPLPKQRYMFSSMQKQTFEQRTFVHVRLVASVPHVFLEAWKAPFVTENDQLKRPSWKKQNRTTAQSILDLRMQTHRHSLTRTITTRLKRPFKYLQGFSMPEMIDFNKRNEIIHKPC